MPIDVAEPVRFVPILMYHAIAAPSSRSLAAFAVRPDVFRKQMQQLAEMRYSPLTVSQYVTTRDFPEQLPEKPIVITFDDAFVNFRVHAWPILARLGFSVTLYVPTAFVGRNANWLTSRDTGDRKVCDWNDLRNIADSGTEIGAHSHTHGQLDLMLEGALAKEIKMPKELLEDQLQKPVVSFAYPYGYHNAMVRSQVRAAGYTSACAVNFQSSYRHECQYALSRLHVEHIHLGLSLAQLLQSKPETVDSLRRRRLAWMWRFVRQAQAYANTYSGIARRRL